jgi:hypothetical protein
MHLVLQEGALRVDEQMALAALMLLYLAMSRILLRRLTRKGER